MSLVLKVDKRSNLLTDINSGLLSIIIQQFGEIDTSQLVNAYNASIVTVGETPLIK